ELGPAARADADSSVPRAEQPLTHAPLKLDGEPTAPEPPAPSSTSHPAGVQADEAEAEKLSRSIERSLEGERPSGTSTASAARGSTQPSSGTAPKVRERATDARDDQPAKSAEPTTETTTPGARSRRLPSSGIPGF